MIGLRQTRTRPAQWRAGAGLRAGPVPDQLIGWPAPFEARAAGFAPSAAGATDLVAVPRAGGEPLGAVRLIEEERGTRIAWYRLGAGLAGTGLASQARQLLAVALFDFALLNGIERLTGAVRVARLPELLALGADMRPTRRLHPDFWAVEILVSAAGCAALRARLDVPAAPLVDWDAEVPA